MKRGIELLLVALVLACVLLTGCASMGVQPWERDLLAQQAMQLNENPLMTGLDEHIYFSKEASTGGMSFGGGGCGCN
jgi:hypothetical protein